MVETTTDVPTVIYRCHVNSKLVTYQMREFNAPINECERIRGRLGQQGHNI